MQRVSQALISRVTKDLDKPKIENSDETVRLESYGSERIGWKSRRAI